MTTHATQRRYRADPPGSSTASGEVIQRCFEDSPYPALRGIRCTVHAGVAQLDGMLPSFYLKQLAQEIARQLEDVKQVNNQIEVISE